MIISHVARDRAVLVSKNIYSIFVAYSTVCNGDNFIYARVDFKYEQYRSIVGIIKIFSPNFKTIISKDVLVVLKPIFVISRSFLVVSR